MGPWTEGVCGSTKDQVSGVDNEHDGASLVEGGEREGDKAKPVRGLLEHKRRQRDNTTVAKSGGSSISTQGQSGVRGSEGERGKLCGVVWACALPFIGVGRWQRVVMARVVALTLMVVRAGVRGIKVWS
jgi:hypothetical protein